MPDVTIKCRVDGPFLITGPVTLTDANGNVYSIEGKANIALCRCGASNNKPFCDGTHKSCGFVAQEMAPPAPDAT